MLLGGALFLGLVSLCLSQEVLVETPIGTLRGKRSDAFGLGGTVDSFLGIPYAKAPVGDLRFAKPEPADPFTDVFNATQVGHACSQGTDIQEDCLFLNVFVPTGATNADVMFWIHGGAYWAGSASGDADGFILSTRGVIVVTINYRLGTLGFLSLGIDGANGNQGIWDQNMALQWVNKNIAAFGGNTESVTIFGESAGSGSVSTHVLSPRSSGLFHKAIMQSGAWNCPWSYRTTDNVIDISRGVAAAVGCSGSDAELLVCLKQADAGALISAQYQYYQRPGHYSYPPVVDGDFLPDTPLNLLSSGQFNDVPLLVGANKNEGAGYATGDFPEYFNENQDSLINREQFMTVATITLNTSSSGYLAQVDQTYVDPNDVENGAKNRDFAVDLLGDYLFLCPSTLFSRLAASQGRSVFYYYFTHRSSTASGQDWMGVTHGSDVVYVFGWPIIDGSVTAEERQISDNFVTHWTTFAKTGNPSTADFTWPAYNDPDLTYVEINSLAVGSPGPRQSFCDVIDNPF